jgi:protein-L-isoaspartate(D-aspartate) O-methyltransferase
MDRSRATSLIIIGLLLPFLLVRAAPLPAESQDDETYAGKRRHMVAEQIEARGVSDPRVLAAMQDVPRHRFVPRSLLSQAYADHPLPIGDGQTISQPYIVALMSACLELNGTEHVLEIGTGSGYQAAVLSHLASRVTTIEIKERLHRRATALLDELGYANVTTLAGDGYFGYPAAAPFDGMMITAAVDHIPPPLLQQLKDNGRLILPLGNPFNYQNLVLVTKQGNDYRLQQITGVLFVPLTGYALDHARGQ